MSVEPPKLPGGRAIGDARRRTWFLIASGLGLVSIQLIRARLDGEWLATGLAIVGGLALGAVLVIRILRADVRRSAVARATGALFGGTATIRIQEVRLVPGLDSAFANTKRAGFTQGMVTGTLVIEHGGLSWQPNRRATRLRAPRFAIPRDQIAAVDAGGLPGLVDPAALAIRLTDGSKITFQTRRLRDLRGALEQAGYPAAAV
jgi:hypothetical protein